MLYVCKTMRNENTCGCSAHLMISCIIKYNHRIGEIGMETDKKIHSSYGRPKIWSDILKGFISVDLKFNIKYFQYNKYFGIQYFFGSSVIK